MALSFVAFAESSSFTGNEPSGAASGDVLIASVTTSSGSAHVGPSGWTQIGTTRDDSTWMHSVWRITRGGSAPDLTWSAGGAIQRVNMIAIRGADASPIDDSDQSTNSVSPSVDASVTNTMLVSVHLDLAATQPAPSGMTLRSGAAFWGQLATEAISATGATGTRTWAGGAGHSSFSILLKPSGSTTQEFMATATASAIMLALTASGVASEVGLITMMVDWTNSGLFDGDYDDVTDRLIGRLSCERGRNVPHPLFGRAGPGKATFMLENRDARYSEYNSGSVLYGDLRAGRAVQYSTIHGDRWGGVVKDIRAGRRGKLPVAIIECEGVFSVIKDRKVNPPANTGDTTGDQVDVVLDEAGWPVGQRNIDAGQTTTSRWYVADKSCLPALRELEDTEGIGFLYEDESRNINFEDRAHRLAGAHLTPQAVYSDAPDADMPYIGIELISSLPYVVNIAEATVPAYSVAGLGVLWTLNETPVLAAGQSREFWANYPNSGSAQGAAYVDAWTTPVVGTDITQSGVANGDIGVAVVKFSTAMKITITNNHGSSAATLTLVQARGTAVTRGDDTTVKAEDTTSQGEYGERTNRNPAPWFPSTDAAQDYVDNTVALYKDQRPLVYLTFLANMNATIFEELMTRLLSDRVTVIAEESITAMELNSDFFVERIEDIYDIDNNRYEVRLGLSSVGDAEAASSWVLGTSTLGTDTYLGF